MIAKLRELAVDVNRLRDDHIHWDKFAQLACDYFLLDAHPSTNVSESSSKLVDTQHAELARDAARYRYICDHLMTDRDGMFEVQQCIDRITTECYMSKESVDEAVDAAMTGESHD
jgi:hypothetical protein